MFGFIKKLFHTEFRIALWGSDGSLTNLSAPSINKLVEKMGELSKEKEDIGITEWAIYKTGPLCLPERHYLSNKTTK